MLHARQVRGENGEAQADRAAHAVVQPDGVPVEVGGGPLVCARQRPGQARLPATEQSVDPAAPLGRRGQVDVETDLGDSEAQFLRPEARVERRDHAGNGLLGRLIEADRGFGCGDRLAQPSQRFTQFVGAPAAQLEQIRSALER